MPFLQLTLDVGAADPEPFEDALLAAGALSITLQDAGDDPVLEPAPGATPLWPRVRVQALFDIATVAADVHAALQGQLPQALPELHFEVLADRIWEREWLKDFHPMRFGQRLWICPGGQRPSPDLLSTPLSVPPCLIELDPGLAFGTGTHPTTALCLEWLDAAQLAGHTVLDYGCGSGVLAIAALKLGAQHATAVDIDPQALLATADNAQRNAVANKLTIGAAATLQPAPVDVLLANILAEPLEALAATFATLVVPGGSLVLSGLLSSQAAGVAQHYAPWFHMAPVTVRSEWARLDATRR
jgi:ribosomal protein L11 methyltransferase